MNRLRALLQPPYRLRSVYERLLGTEVELQVVAASRRTAEAAEQAALEELERLNGLLNRFDPQSEWRRLLARPDEAQAVSADLRAVLELAEHWQHATDGAFHPGADALGAVWSRAAGRGHLPDPAELAEVVIAIQGPLWTVHSDGRVTVHTLLPLGANALAKGYVVDQMAERAFAQAEVQAVLVNAGGDLRTLGGRGLQVAVADPFTARDDASPLTRVQVQNAALATSGQAHRGWHVGQRWYSHLLDPRTGQPVMEVPGVTVVAPLAVTADALATALSVLNVAAGLALADRTPGAAALIVTEGGIQHTSRRWAALTSG
ncbi:FAD:protein FMN transferase [Deinococcus navajonensis]|uniref:FAD:protein FMN transferase n=1 Tax=Deinococcus navajonensis TaxID=309884 RepID=A0ABV8XRR6_9DEIO